MENVTQEEINALAKQILDTKITDIGEGRGGGFDRTLLLKKMVALQKQSKTEAKLFAKLVKTFGIKFCIHGTRIKQDNRVTIDGKEYTAEGLVGLFEFSKAGKGTDSSQLTPTRMARLFATDAVNYLADHVDISPPFWNQDNIRVMGLPREYHFIAAMYAKGSATYAKQIVEMCKNFDSTLDEVIKNFDKKNGFAVRARYFFDHVQKGQEEYGLSVKKEPQVNPDNDNSKMEKK